MAGDGSRKKAVNRGSSIARGNGKIPMTRGGDARGKNKSSAINKGNGTDQNRRRDFKTIRTGSNIKRGRG